MAVPVTLLLIAITPVHFGVQKGARGRMGVAGQVLRMQLWPTSVALRCGVYSLSWNLGLRVFPEVEGACEPFFPKPGQPMAELNANPWLKPEIRGNFTYLDGVKAVAKRPFKYLLVCGVSLLGAVWLDGVYPAAVSSLGEGTRTVLWLLKVALSSALWFFAVAALVVGWRTPERRRLLVPLAASLAYILCVHANFLGEVRYFYPALPLLYLLASQWILWRSQEGPASTPIAR